VQADIEKYSRIWEQFICYIPCVALSFLVWVMVATAVIAVDCGYVWSPGLRGVLERYNRFAGVFVYYGLGFKNSMFPTFRHIRYIARECIFSSQRCFLPRKVFNPDSWTLPDCRTIWLRRFDPRLPLLADYSMKNTRIRLTDEKHGSYLLRCCRPATTSACHSIENLRNSIPAVRVGLL
jgi:hypothetical protein